MNYFISNFKAQTLKSILITALITSVAVCVYWNLQSLVDAFSFGTKWFPTPVSFLIPFFIEVIIYTLGIAFLISRKGWISGLVLGYILTGLFIIPDFISYAFRPDGSLTLTVAVLVTIDNLIKLAIPATLLAHFRNS